MSIVQHKFLSSVLAILSLVLLVLLVVTFDQANRYKQDVRYAHSLAWGFNMDRDLALKGELPETMVYLEELNFPEGQPSPFSGSLSNFVETQRRRDVDDIIVYLRAKTGKNLGDKAEAWIQEYGKK